MNYIGQTSTGRQPRYPTGIGDIKGVGLFECFDSHSALSAVGLHGKPGAGIHGNGDVGAFSVVLSGGYEDDEDRGDIVIYTGEGGRDRHSGTQIANQVWKRGNAALQLSLDTGYPVRLIRSSTLNSRYAPIAPSTQSAIYRYDGLYRVLDAEHVAGKSGFTVCRFVLQRLPGQAPLPVLSRPMNEQAAQGFLHGQHPSFTTPTAGPSTIPTARRGVVNRRHSAQASPGFAFKCEGGKTEPWDRPPPGYR